jgi:hypothetical protein
MKQSARKRLGIIVLPLLIIASIAGGWDVYVRKKREQRCLLNMESLYSAAVSHSLAEKLSADSLQSVDTLSQYLNTGSTRCPSGTAFYASFTVLQGPVCPNGHVYAPGVERPLKTTTANRKVAGLYLASGYTNLVLPEPEIRPVPTP